jgi:hypothetical protein
LSSVSQTHREILDFTRSIMLLFLLSWPLPASVSAMVSSQYGRLIRQLSMSRRKKECVLNVIEATHWLCNSFIRITDPEISGETTLSNFVVASFDLLRRNPAPAQLQQSRICILVPKRINPSRIQITIGNLAFHIDHSWYSSGSL